jgi:UDP-glucuronate 4-epimerase
VSKDPKILVTGAAGFIGFHLTRALRAKGLGVTGVDNLNSYYDVSLKESRLRILQGDPHFVFRKVDLGDAKGIKRIFEEGSFTSVINLAAQAGVRYSITNPGVYVESNINGFLNILEGCRHTGVSHLIYASSSSVYGANTKMPFSTTDAVDHPISLYAATKKANELMAHTYSALFKLPTTGLRFFTVYGPYGRPDMALFLFTKAILEGKPIDVFNNGKMRRDFTYVDDIVEGIVRLINHVPAGSSAFDPSDPSRSFAPYRLFNIGNNQPVELMKFIDVLEERLGRKAIRNFLPMQDGDVRETYADVDDLEKEIGFRPKTSIEAGIDRFVDWYLNYYK